MVRTCQNLITFGGTIAFVALHTILSIAKLNSYIIKPTESQTYTNTIYVRNINSIGQFKTSEINKNLSMKSIANLYKNCDKIATF